MDPADYGGVIWKAYVSPNTDGTDFVEVGKVFDVSTDNSTDEVTRNFIDGTSLSIPTNFVPKINFTTTNTTAANLGVALPGNTYAPGDEIEGADGATAGESGATQIGPNRASKPTTIGTFKLVPQNAAQVGHTVTLFNATLTANDFTFNDNLVEVPIVATGEKVVIGEVTYPTAPTP